MKKQLNIAYMAGGADYTIEPLKELIKSKHMVSCVFTKQPKKSGKAKKTNVSKFLGLIKENNIKCEFPKDLRQGKFQEILKELKIDIILVFSYGLILPKEVLRIPKLGCINIHASILPRWRGPSPIQYSLLSGDDLTGYCFMVMELKVDRGAVFFKEEIPIGEKDNSTTLLNKVSLLSAKNIVLALENFSTNKFNAIIQDESHVTYSYKIKKCETYITFNDKAKNILGKIRAYNFNPGAKCIIKGEVLKILDASVEENLTEINKPGTVIDNNLLISCKDKALRLLIVQREGRKPMLTKHVLNGWKVPKGTLIDEKK